MKKSSVAEDRSLAVDSEVLRPLRIALVHDYLNQNGGAEKVVEVFCRMFPAAPLYTSVYDPAVMEPFWRDVDIRTSFMQKLSPRLSIAKALLPLYPKAFESFDLSGYDLVLSSASTFAKGVRSQAGTCHVCYCYTPSRFAWMYQEYVERQELPPGARFVLPAVVGRLRKWDYAAGQRPDEMIGISRAVAERIRTFYGRVAKVIEPPVNVADYAPSDNVDEYFLIVARLAPYKRIDIAVEACTRLGVPLKVVGSGPAREALERLAGPSVTFLGRVGDEDVRTLLARCKALLWPGEEDFGLVPVEAQAAGRPVIAYAAGGALETVIDGQTGVLFSPQTVEVLIQAIQSFDGSRYDVGALRANAERFDLPRFVSRMTAELERAVIARRAQS
jgi:glycosyltransferase involved in cell wall biosynthesis